MRKLLSLVVVYLCLNMVVLADAREDIRIYDVKLSENSQGAYQVIIPRIKGFADDKFERSLNNRIEETYQAYLKDYARSAQEGDSLDVNYQLKLNQELISLVIIKEESLAGQTGKTREYINIDREKEAPIVLKDILKPEAKFPGINLEDRLDFYLDSQGNLGLIENNFDKAKGAFKEHVFSQEATKDILVDKALVGLVYLEEELDPGLKGDLSLVIPQLKGLGSSSFQEQLNETIRQEAQAGLESFKARLEGKDSQELEYRLNYEIRSFNQLLSIEMSEYFYLDEKNAGSRKYYYNIDLDKNQLLGLDQLFKDQSYLDFINKKILEKIDKNKSDYFSNDKKFKGLGQDPDFYIDSYGNLVLVFQENTITDQARVLPEFRISSYQLRDFFTGDYKTLGLRDPKKFIINSKINYFRDYMNISERGNILIPLDQIIEDFDFDLGYSQDKKTIKLERDGVKYSFNLGDNHYAKDTAIIIMEEPSQHINGLIYVPLNYIDLVLGGKTSIVDGVVNIELN